MIELVAGVLIPVLSAMTYYIIRNSQDIRRVQKAVENLTVEIKTLAAKFETFEKRLTAVEQRFDELSGRFSVLETEFREVRKIVTEINGTIRETIVRLTKLETEFRNHLKYLHGKEPES